MGKTKRIDLLKQELSLLLSNPTLVMAQKMWSQQEYDNYITELQKKIEQSKRGKGSKRKGSTYERKVAKIYKDKLGIELVRTPMSGGFQKDKKATNIKGDLSCLDESIDFQLHTECKDQKTIRVRDWFEQSCADCPQGKIPTVVSHLIRQIKDGKEVSKSEHLIILRVEDFLDIVDKSKIIVPKRTKRIVRKK